MKKRLKLLLSKEDGKINKMSLLFSSMFFLGIKELNSYSLNNVLFNITEPEIVEHLHNFLIYINETEPPEIRFTYQKKDTCLIITAIGGSACCYNAWNDITGDFGQNTDNYYLNYSCQYDPVLNKKTCWVKASDYRNTSYGFIKYEYYNKTTSDDCYNQKDTFFTDVYSEDIGRVNTWKNFI